MPGAISPSKQAEAPPRLDPFQSFGGWNRADLEIGAPVPDELRHIVEFIQAGGLNRARTKELEELERQRRELNAAKITSSFDNRSAYASTPYDLPESIIGFAAGALVSSFFD